MAKPRCLPKVAAVPGLDAQVKLQFETANRLADVRAEQGALELGTIQANPVVNDQGKVTELAVVEDNGARELIASFMIAANVAMATFLENAGRLIYSSRGSNSKILVAHR